jgi:expansin (peptidoglycan-binding protein)
LKAVPNLQGRIEIGWSVFDGQVSGVYVVSNSTGDSELAGCIEKKIRRWRFPAGKVEGDISWPFVFKAKKG